MISDNLNLLFFAHHLDDEKAAVISTDGNRGNPNMTIVSEPGVRERANHRCG